MIRISAGAIAEAAFVPVAAALAAGPIPGAVLGVVTAGGDRALRVGGLSQKVPVALPMTAETWFDLASLTKVIFTTTTILRLAAEGALDLDAPLISVIPDLRQYDMAAAERRLTFRQCLMHDTHLPAVEPLYTYGQDPMTVRAFVLQRVWQPGPPVYSDINFLLLGIAIERLMQQAVAADLHANPLPQLSSTKEEGASFSPSLMVGASGGGATEPQVLMAHARLPNGLAFHPDPAHCAATEFCTWRGKILRGVVHDENACAFGGAAGHAGLFGTADGVLDFAAGLLTGTGMSPAGITAIRARGARNRTVGWEAAYPGWSGGDGCSVGTIGHTGFTGTGLWIDFDSGIAWTLLTNRVHPSRHVDSGIHKLRRIVGDAVAAAISD